MASSELRGLNTATVSCGDAMTVASGRTSASALEIHSPTNRSRRRLPVQSEDTPPVGNLLAARLVKSSPLVLSPLVSRRLPSFSRHRSPSSFSCRPSFARAISSTVAVTPNSVLQRWRRSRRHSEPSSCMPL